VHRDDVLPTVREEDGDNFARFQSRSHQSASRRFDPFAKTRVAETLIRGRINDRFAFPERAAAFKYRIVEKDSARVAIKCGPHAASKNSTNALSNAALTLYGQAPR
jgi:hypothetical protein